MVQQSNIVIEIVFPWRVGGEESIKNPLNHIHGFTTDKIQQLTASPSNLKSNHLDFNYVRTMILVN